MTPGHTAKHEERRKAGALDRRKNTPASIAGIVQALRDNADELELLNNAAYGRESLHRVTLIIHSTRNLANTIEGTS